MIVTARQLEDLHRQNGGNGRVVLPYRARLTPLAQDWVRSKRVALGYSDAGAIASAASPATEVDSSACCTKCAHDTGKCCSSSSTYLWWCDGPCGPAKAALVAFEKESSLRPLDLPQDARRVAEVVKSIAQQVKSSQAQAAVLMVQSGAVATVFANRCPSLRAVLGTCLESVEQGIQQLGANVLVIEYPHRTLQQMKNMIGRFVRARRELPEDVRRQLQELASCG